MTCCARCRWLSSSRVSSNLLRFCMVCCTCPAIVEVMCSSSRNSCASWRSRSSAVSGEPVSRPLMDCSCARHCCMLLLGRPSVTKLLTICVASLAVSEKRTRSTRSSSTTDWRALRSIVTLRSPKDWASRLNSNAWAAPSRLCRVRSSRANSARTEAAPSKAAINRKARTSSCRNENRWRNFNGDRWTMPALRRARSSCASR